MLRFHFDTIDSTNDAARRLIAEGKITDRAFVTATHQSAGKGTRKRTWQSPAGAGIYLTTVRTESVKHMPATAAYTLAAGVACAEAIAEATGVAVQLKPINDLYANGAKLGGILTECIVAGPRINAIITGVGINVRHTPLDLPADSAPSISLEELMTPDDFESFLPDSLIDALVERIDAWHDRITADNISEIETAWVRYQLPGTVAPVVPRS
jgi:BirA family transcriptional regulator, biotin operon repressor / biotin---[acetyl-CoA-carboxylase] ligase